MLGQVKVADKSNEIVAIPKLLDLLAIEGAVVTIDAIGCQRDIAQKILAKKADYVLALKGNQGTLREDVELRTGKSTAIGAWCVACVSGDASSSKRWRILASSMSTDVLRRGDLRAD